MQTPSPDPLDYLETARRPRLLMEAARLGLGGYDRARRLPRLLGAMAAPAPVAC